MELVPGFLIRGGPIFTGFSGCEDFEDEIALAEGLKLDTGICGWKLWVSLVLTPLPCIDFSVCGDFEGELALAGGLGLEIDIGEGNGGLNRWPGRMMGSGTLDCEQAPWPLGPERRPLFTLGFTLGFVDWMSSFASLTVGGKGSLVAESLIASPG